MASEKAKKPNKAVSKAAATRAANREAERKQREMTGVLLIAAGILLGIYMFVSASGVLGEWLSQVLFGLCGTLCYLLPLILVGFGYVTIKGSTQPGLRGSGWFLILGVLASIMLLNLLYDAPFQNVRYMTFLQDAYAVGSVTHVGGGFVGAVLSYPILLLGGKALAYTLSIALILIAIIAVTNLSLKDVTKKVKGGMQQAAERVRSEAVEERRLYQEEVNSSREKLRVYSADQDVSSGGAGTDATAQKRKKKRSKNVSEALDDVLSFMPLEGELQKKPVVSDSWDDFEPDDDVPLIIKPVRQDNLSGSRKKSTAATSPIDPLMTQKLFGRQEAAKNPAPEETTASKKEAKARVTDYQPVSAKTAGKDAPIDVAPAASDPAAYAPPSFSLLDAPRSNYAKNSESPNEKGRLLIDTLQSFGISAKIVDISVGPVLTRFELQPAPGVRVSRITGLSNDIALALAAPRVRIEAPIPGKAAVGIEIPNKDAVTVVLRDIVESKEFMNASSPIALAFGKDISGKVITADLAKMPHLLIAGSTGSGKSVCINDLIISMVYKSSPKDLRLILIDPKMVELSNFSCLPHLYIPVVTDPKKASGALRWAVNEMTKRYKAFSELGARDLARFNALQQEPEKRLPKMVVVIDELADLMMVAPDEVEDSICRIAQLGRAAGIHLIVATQRPSADVITGLIKANIPSRCAFAVSSGIDSRIILDTTGAEKLLGKGDMLFHMNGANKPIRLQCAFVSDEEVERIVDYFRNAAHTPVFDDKIMEEVDSAAIGGATGGVFGEGKQEDDLLPEALRIVIEAGQASTSLIQRRLRVGYARGSRLLDMMEQAGYVSEQEGTKPRRILIKRSEYEEIFGVALPPPEKQVP